MQTFPLPGGGTVTYVTRADWGGGPVRAGHSAPESQFRGWVQHHTTNLLVDYDRDGYLHGDIDDVLRYMRWLQTARPDLGNEVPYSWVGFQGARPIDAIVCEGRGAGRTGAHTKGWNSVRYGFAWATNTTLEPLTPGMREGFRWCATEFTEAPVVVATTGHRDYVATQCPGESAYAGLPLAQPPFEPFTPGPDPIPTPWEEPEMIVVKHGTERWLLGGTRKRGLRGPQASELVAVLGQGTVPEVGGDLLGRFITDEPAPTLAQVQAAVASALAGVSPTVDLAAVLNDALADAFAAAAASLDD